MTHPPQDLMAGASARHAREHPGEPRPISDPTDPRYGRMPRLSERRPISDPTDPRYGTA